MARTAGAVAGAVLNHGDSSVFGRSHVILNGRTSQAMRVDSFTGPFSIKTVVTGSATWETADGRNVLTPGRHLILDRGTKYSLTITGDTPVETFCVFFRDGYLEEALRSLTETEATLLDAPEERARSFALLEAIHDSTQSLGSEIAAPRPT